MKSAIHLNLYSYNFHRFWNTMFQEVYTHSTEVASAFVIFFQGNATEA